MPLRIIIQEGRAGRLESVWMKGSFVDLALKIVLKDQPEFLAIGHIVLRILGLH